MRSAAAVSQPATSGVSTQRYNLGRTAAQFYSFRCSSDSACRLAALHATATAQASTYVLKSSEAQELKGKAFQDYESATQLISTLQQETNVLTQLLQQNEVSIASLDALNSEPFTNEAPQTLSAQARRDRRQKARLERQLVNGGAATTTRQAGADTSASRSPLSTSQVVDPDALSQHKLVLEGTFSRSPDVEPFAGIASTSGRTLAPTTSQPRSVRTSAPIIRRPVITSATAVDATSSTASLSSSSSSQAAPSAVGAMAFSAASTPTSFGLAPLPPTVITSTRSARQRSSKRTSRTTARSNATAVVDTTDKNAGSGDTALNTPGDGTSILMKPASSVLLTADQEKNLAMVAQDLMFLKRVRKQLQQALKRWPTELEWARAVDMDVTMFAARRDAGERAKLMMLQSNYRLVISVCKKYQYKGTHMQDLIAEGIQGLIRGIEKYDASKGFRFSTYAHWWIRQAVTRSIADQGRTVRLPVHVTEALSRIRTAQAALEGTTGRNVSSADVAAAVGMSVEKMEQIMSMVRAPSSLEAPMAGSDGTSTMADLLEDESASPEEQLTAASMSADVEAILQQLPEREAGVLRMRYGLVDGHEKTLEECGNYFQVTRERIRQIEAKALLKLKAYQADLDKGFAGYGILDVDGRELAARNSLGTKKT